MVRPKTTALFFEKLWVHPVLIKGFRSDALEIYRVPPEVCVTEPLGAADYYDSGATQRVVVATKWMQVAEYDVDEALRRLDAETWDLRAIFEIEAMEHFEGKKTRLWEQMSRALANAESLEWTDDFEVYLTTHKRNKAIAFIVQIYAAKGIRLTPIYLSLAEYDEVAVHQNTGVEICLDCIPTVVESQLTWEQVLEVRKDRESIEKLARLRRWFTIDLARKGSDEIRATVEKKLDDYQYALKKHGVQTSLGGVTSMLSFVAGPAEVLSRGV